MSCLVAFHYRSYGTFFLQQNRLHKIHRGFTHYKYYRAKITYEDKVQSYAHKKQGQSLKQLSKRFSVDVSGLRYMMRLIEHFGIESIKKVKNYHYSPEPKQEMIDKFFLVG